MPPCIRAQMRKCDRLGKRHSACAQDSALLGAMRCAGGAVALGTLSTGPQRGTSRGGGRPQHPGEVPDASSSFEQKLLQEARGDRERPGGEHVCDCSGSLNTYCCDIVTSVQLSVHHRRLCHLCLSSMTRLCVPSTFDLGQVRGAEDLLSRTWQLKEACVRNARVSSSLGPTPW